MAAFEVEGFDELIKNLSQLEFDRIAPGMLEESAPILERNIKSRAQAHVRTGSMSGSISAGKIKKKSDGYSISVRPTGSDSKGVRNMEKMVYLEYGTTKQAATPVLSPAVAASEAPVQQKMQEVFDRHVKGL